MTLETFFASNSGEVFIIKRWRVGRETPWWQHDQKGVTSFTRAILWSPGPFAEHFGKCSCIELKF